MSIFDKAKRKIRHAAKQAERTVSHTATTATGAVSDVANQIGDTVADLSPEHIANELKNQVVSSLKSVENEAISAIHSAANQATSELKKLSEQLIKELEDDLKKIEDKLVSLPEHEVLNFLIKIVEAIEPSYIRLQISGFIVQINKPIEKIEHIKKWAASPPSGHDEWKAFVNDITPDTIALTASVGFALFIESDEANVAVEAGIEEAEIADKIDAILEHV